MKLKATKKKKRPSGSAYRKARRLRLAKAAGVPVELLRGWDVGRLKTFNDWRTQLARIYRRAVTGELPEFLATKLAYIASTGASFAKMAEELKELTQLREQLAALQGAPPTRLITHDEARNAINGEVTSHENEE